VHYCDEFLYSSLFARKLDIARTIELLEHNWKWRVVNGFETLPSSEDLDWEFSKTNMMIPGCRTKEGHGIIYWQIKESDPGSLDMNKILRWCAWFYLSPGTMVGMDVARNGAFLIQDLDGLGWRHVDVKFQKKILELYQDNFPARLHKSMQLNSPMILKMIWGLFRPLLKKKLVDRFFLGTKEDLLSYIDKDQLWENYGGTRKYSHEEWVKDVLQYEKDFKAEQERRQKEEDEVKAGIEAENQGKKKRGSKKGKKKNKKAAVSSVEDSDQNKIDVSKD